MMAAKAKKPYKVPEAVEKEVVPPEIFIEAPQVTLRVDFHIDDTHVAWVETSEGRVEVTLNDDAGPWDMALFDGLVDLMRRAADWRVMPTPFNSGHGQKQRTCRKCHRQHDNDRRCPRQ